MSCIYRKSRASKKESSQRILVGVESIIVEEYTDHHQMTARYVYSLSNRVLFYKYSPGQSSSTSDTMGKTVESTLMNRIRWVIEATEEGTVQLVYIHTHRVVSQIL